MAKKRKSKGYIIWISLLAGLIFLGGVAALLYMGRGKIRTWTVLRGKEPLERGKIYARLNRYSEAISEFKRELEKNPTSFDAHFQLGQSFRRLGEFDQALAEYELARSLQPESTETTLQITSTYLNKAIQYRSSGQDDATVSELLQQAMTSCDQILINEPQDHKALVLKGKIHIEQNEPEKAVTCFKNALAIENDYVPAHLGLVNLYTVTSDYEKAESQCLEALKQNPKNFSIGLNLAIIYSYQGRYEEALETLDETTSTRQNQLQAGIMRGLLYLRMGRYEEAVAAAETVSKLTHKNIPVVEYIRGVVALQEKDYHKAISHLRQASVYMPRSVEAHYFLALALIQTHKREEAKTELVSAISSTPEYIPAKLTLAQLLAKEARWEEASNYAKEVLELEPENVLAVQLLGMTYQAQGKFQEAQQEFTRLMERAPSSAKINLAYLSLSAGEVEKCLRTCDEVLAKDPNQPRVLYLKGLALLRIRNFPRARQCFNKVLELEPGFLPATRQLAKTSLALGNKEEAIAILTNNLKQDERDIPSRLLLARIHEEKDINNAKKEVEKVIDIDKEYLPSYIVLGRIYISQQRYDKAIDTYKRALRLRPSMVSLHIGLGTAYHLTEDLERAEAAFADALRLAPKSPLPYVMLGNVYLHADKSEKAVEIIEDSYLNQEQRKLYLDFIGDFQAARPDPVALQYLNEAIFFELNRLYSNALERCREVDTAMPGNTLVSMYLGNLLMARGRSKEAVEVFEELTLSDSDEFRLPTTIYREMGKTYLLMKDYKKAIWALEEVVATDQGASLPRLQLSHLYLQKGDTERAQALAEEVLLQDPNNVLALNLLGQTHLLRGKLDEAEAEFSKAAGEGRLQDLSRYNLAKTMFARGKIEDCIEECRNGLEENPLNHHLHNLLGTALMQKGEIVKALEEFTKVININPSFIPAYLSIASIHNLQGRSDLALSVCNLALESNPESLEARLMLAGSYVGLARYDHAQEQYRRCLAEENDHPLALFGLATTYALKEDTSKALETLQKLLDKRRDIPQAYILLAEIHKRQGQVPHAIQVLEELLEIAPQSVPFATLACLYLQQGEYDKCIEVTHQGDTPLHLWIRAVANQMEGQYQEAEANYQEAGQARQGDASIALSLANIALASGQRQRARATIDQSRLSAAVKQAYSDLLDTAPEDTASELAAHLNSMLIYRVGGLVKQALEECKKAKALAPESIVISNFLGESLIAAGETEQAAETFASIIQKDSTFSPAYRRLALLDQQRGDEEGALEMYRRLVEVEPDSGQAHLQIATLLEKKGNLRECIEEYKKTIDLAPRSAIGVVAFNNLAWILATERGRVEESLELALKAIEMAPNNAGVRDTLGWIYYLNGQYAEALRELRQATQLAYGNPTMHFHLGAAYLKKEMGYEALAQLQKAVKGGADFPELEEAKRLIQEIESGDSKLVPLSAL
ncbi:MAG: tetratricopeptide repeat protein [Candidatus Brocadiales bacterium]